MAMGWLLSKRFLKSSRARNWATVNLLVSLITSPRLNLPNHSLCSLTWVLLLSTTLKNCCIYVSALRLTSSAVSMGRVID